RSAADTTATCSTTVRRRRGGATATTASRCASSRKKPERFAVRCARRYAARVIDLVDVRKRFGRARLVLGGVTLHVAAGEFIAVRGESGIGKSTLLNLIAGLDRPD